MSPANRELPLGIGRPGTVNTKRKTIYWKGVVSRFVYLRKVTGKIIAEGRKVYRKKRKVVGLHTMT